MGCTEKSPFRETNHLPPAASCPGSLAKGTTKITGFLQGADCLSTISCFQKMGVSIDNLGDTVLVHGNGLHGLKKPEQVLDCGNSGTTTRLISGILSAQDFSVTLTGDASIQKRPMKRIMEPLSQMGADITSVNGNGCAPLAINGRLLHGIHYQSPVASAQVKSAILLAGLYAKGETKVTEPSLSRNHTELMLKEFGADVRTEKNHCHYPTGRRTVCKGDWPFRVIFPRLLFSWPPD